MIVNIPTAPVFAPLLQPARYLGGWGGRGGAKSHFFAEKLIDDSLYQKGLLSVCVREVQKSLRDSSKRLIESKLAKFGLGERQGFKVFADVIETPGDGVIIFQGMQNHTAESIKSLEGFHRGWWDEAQKATATSLAILRPSFFRVPNCQLWFSWNPKEPPDPANPQGSVDGLLRGAFAKELGAIVVESQFSDNPWFPGTDLAKEEAFDRAHRQPEDYAHIWRGAYLTRSEARVFKNWKVEAFDTPKGAIHRFGADFGFSVDPSVLVRMFIGRWENVGLVDALGNSMKRAVADEKGRTLFIEFEAYRVGCDVDHTPALFAGPCPFSPDDPRAWKNPYGDTGIEGAMDWSMVCDNARPETISYLQRHGFQKAVAAIKGPGSLQEGIEFLKTYDIVIHPRCTHTIDEFTFYSFKEDPLTGKILPVLVDKKNHVIDATRYAVEDVRRGRPTFF